MAAREPVLCLIWEADPRVELISGHFSLSPETHDIFPLRLALFITFWLVEPLFWLFSLIMPISTITKPSWKYLSQRQLVFRDIFLHFFLWTRTIIQTECHRTYPAFKSHHYDNAMAR
jgi:hypothetical protein